MVLNYDIVVDLTPEFNKQLSPKFSVSLGDHGSREYMAKILQSGEPYEIAEGSLVSIVGKKPDGHIFAYDCTFSDEYVYFTIEEQMTPVSGIVACELVIIDTDGHKLGSANFTFWVEPCPVSDGEASESDLQMFQEILDAADDLADVREILDRAVPIAEEIGDIDKMLAAFPTPTASGPLLTLTAGADGIPVKTLTLNLTPHQSGSGDPSPDNVRPISGYTDVTVTRAGKNLLSLNVGTTTINGITFEIKADGTVHVYGTSTAQASIAIGTTEELPEALYRFGGIPIGATNSTYFMTRSIGAGNMFADGDYTMSGALAPRIYVRNEVSCDVVFKPFIGLASEAQTYTLTIPTSAGTVYGGQFTVDQDGSGTLVVDRAHAIIDGTESVTLSTANNPNGLAWLFTKPLTATEHSLAVLAESVSDKAKCIQNKLNSTINATECRIVSSNQGTRVQACFICTDPNVTTLAEVKAWLADHPYELVYPIDPVTYTLTTEQVTTLLGDNTVWMDADGTIDLAYRADTQMYIDNRLALLNANLAYIEDGMTASRAYTVGQFVLIGGQLYKVTSAIASGATFTIGTNVVSTTVGTELTDLN